MSPKIRLASAVLVSAALACGSLGALPLGPRLAPPESGGGGILMAVVEWFASLFSPDPHSHEPRKPVQTKSGATADPNGGPE